MRDRMVIICAVNNEHTLQRDLMASHMTSSGEVPVFSYRGARTAGEAYNAGIDATNEEFMIFAHQDVYLPRNWDLQISRHIQFLEENGVRWGVLGCLGVTASGEFAGTVWSSGAGREYKNETQKPVEVRSLDEVVLVVRRSTNIRFDARLPNFHLYGTDIVLSASSAGYTSYAVTAPIIHNSNQLLGLDQNYRTAFAYMCDKWSAQLPVRTPICNLSSNRLGLLRTRFRIARQLLFRRLQGRSVNQPLPNPRLKAQELGYDDVQTLD